MNWKLYAGVAGILAAAVFSLAGCGTNTEVTETQDQTNQAEMAPNQDGLQPGMEGSQDNSQSNFARRPDGQRAQGNPDNQTAPSDSSGLSQGQRPSRPQIDYASAAAALGVTEQQLRDALTTDEQKPPDLKTAASTLGVTEEALMNALGFKQGMQPGGGNPPGGQDSGFQPQGAQTNN
jgi:hypothetical protein